MASGDSTKPVNGFLEGDCEHGESSEIKMKKSREINKVERHDDDENDPSENGGAEYEESFDFTNPDSLIQQLEKVNLTDEDTEELLHEAYKVNMKLKEILRRQESKRRGRMSSAQSAYSPGSKPNRTHGTHETHGSSALPPIQRRSNTTHATSRVLSGSKQSSSSNIAHGSAKRKDDPKQSRRSSTSKSTKEKPIWDDRFSYS